ncbi:hypothetical protein ES703_124754 [subsurface metagenome]
MTTGKVPIPLTLEKNKDSSLGKYAALEVSPDGKTLVFVYEKEYEEKEKKKCEDLYGKPYDMQSDNFKRTLKKYWWRPPWKFNDTVGYLSIGTDTGGCLTADIFLKRKHLPKEHHDRRALSPKRTNEILYFREMDRFPKGEGNNDAYLQSLNELIETAKKIIKKLVRLTGLEPAT